MTASCSPSTLVDTCPFRVQADKHTQLITLPTLAGLRDHLYARGCLLFFIEVGAFEVMFVVPYLLHVCGLCSSDTPKSYCAN